MKRSYALVEPDLRFSTCGVTLDQDQITKCLSFLVKHFHHTHRVPEWWKGEVIAAQYIGDKYPVIGYYVEEVMGDVEESLIPNPLLVGDEMSAYVQEVGIHSIIEMSEGETLSWEDVFMRA